MRFSSLACLSLIVCISSGLSVAVVFGRFRKQCSPCSVTNHSNNSASSMTEKKFSYFILPLQGKLTDFSEGFSSRGIREKKAAMIFKGPSTYLIVGLYSSV